MRSSGVFAVVNTVFCLITLDYLYQRRRLRLAYARMIRERGPPPTASTEARSRLFRRPEAGEKPSIYVRVVDWFDRHNSTNMALVAVIRTLYSYNWTS